MTVALDLFAGTGWGVACERLGVEEHGVDNAPAVLATREAHGMRTAYSDVWAGLDDPSLVPEHDLLIASPPCQTFSLAGGGSGRQALDAVLGLIEDGAYLDPAELRAFGEQHDDRTALVLTPLTYAMRYRPDVVVLEQVPPVLPVWQAIGRVLAMNGYQVASGVLNAEQYGVPQTRKRAILIARRGGYAALPTPTHSRFYSRDPERLDPGVQRWVSMAEALRWGMTARPYPTIACSRSSGGPDKEKVGGSAARALIYRERDEGRWLEPDLAAVAAAVAERVHDQSGTPYDPTWPAKRPATTIPAIRGFVQHPGATANRFNGSTQSRNDGIRLTVEEAACLQSYPDGFAWVGSRTATFQQIGNAVPPLLAEAVLRAALAPPFGGLSHVRHVAPHLAHRRPITATPLREDRAHAQLRD